MKDRVQNLPSLEEYLSKTLPTGSRVGIDPKLVSKGTAQRYASQLEAHGHKLVYVDNNLVDEVWGSDSTHTRSPASTQPIVPHPISYSGCSTDEKLQIIREAMKQEQTDILVVAALDEIAWVLNIRGSDIPFNPVVISYALIGQECVKFFVDETKVTNELRTHLGNHIQILPYGAIFEELHKLDSFTRLWLDSRSSVALFNATKCELVVKSTPIVLQKAIKNQTELEGMRQSHIRDAAALIKFFAWLEREMQQGNTHLDECSVADKLFEFRSKQRDFVSLSFETIAGSGPNGAIIHYKPEKDTCAKIEKKMFLCDSGGQYKDGTTDVTRTLHFGTPSQHERECYTRVLMGHIALGSITFPGGYTTGKDVDLLARMHLWQIGLDYAHGTGHGVGAFLNVHEGPHGISSRAASAAVPFACGMIVTNEPGYYEEGNFGIRIENVMAVIPVATQYGTDFFGFEQVTLVPYEANLLELPLLTERDMICINAYHKKCEELVGPLLNDDPLALNWLKKRTTLIVK
jgi:Xaa-Pro aminopeptidase